MEALIYIVARPFKHVERYLDFADRYDNSKLNLSDMTDRTMKKSGYVVPLTRENYARMIAHRPVGTVGAGFTIAFLLERGIINNDDATAVGDHELGAEKYKGYWIAMKRVNNRFKKFDVLNAANEPMRPKMFNQRDAAAAFIDGLPPADQEVHGDGVHIQSGLSAAA